MNALPQLAAATVNCRVLAEDSIEYVQARSKRYLPTTTRVTDSLWPAVAVIPIMVPGVTDGRVLHAVGIPTLRRARILPWIKTISVCTAAMSA
jgi:hypothetical protein